MHGPSIFSWFFRGFSLNSDPAMQGRRIRIFFNFEKVVMNGTVSIDLPSQKHKKMNLQDANLMKLLADLKNIVFEKSLKDFRDSRRPKKLRMLINIQCWRYLDRETLTPTIEYTLSQTKIIKISNILFFVSKISRIEILPDKPWKYSPRPFQRARARWYRPNRKKVSQNRKLSFGFLLIFSLSRLTYWSCGIWA